MLGTLGGALAARQVDPNDGRLSAEATGEIEQEDGVLVIRRIHVSFRLAAPEDARPAVERAHAVYAMSCPLYRTLRGAVAISSSFELTRG